MSLTQNLGQPFHDLVTENAELTQQLMRKEAKLSRAEETIRREQQQIQEMRRMVRFQRECVKL